MSLSLGCSLSLVNIMNPTAKIRPTGRDLVVYILPIFMLQYTMVQLKHTALFHISILPIVLWTIKVITTTDVAEWGNVCSAYY